MLFVLEHAVNTFFAISLLKNNIPRYLNLLVFLGQIFKRLLYMHWEGKFLCGK